MRTGLSVLTLLAAFAVASGWAQGPIQYTKEDTRPLSPSVLGMFLSREGGRVELLVLWRGPQGWYQGPGGATGSATGDGYHTSIRRGQVNIDFTYDRSRGTARVGTIDVPLAGKNVLLIDRVDSSEGPSLTTAAADLTYVARPGGGVAPAAMSTEDVVAMLSRSATLVSFLQCDAAAAEPATRQRSAASVCDQLRR